MNKVLKSLVVGGLGLMMLPGMVKADIDGDVLTSPGSSSSGNAYVNSIDDSDKFNVALVWGSLQYDYVKQTENSYAWVPVNDESNYIEVMNGSTMSVNAELSWNAEIEGTTAHYYGVSTDYDNRVCSYIYYPEQPYNWNGDGWDEFGNVVSNKYALGDETDPIYTDDKCSNLVAEGTEFTAGGYYAYRPSEGYFEGGSKDITSTQAAKFYVTILGGEKSDVEAALAGDKIIGSVTVTISEADSAEG